MKIFIDSANIEEIRLAASMGLVDGVTTNPTLVAKEKTDFKTLLQRICEIIDGPISAEVIGTEAKAMIDEGKTLAKLHKNIVVKIPLTKNGLIATKALTELDIKTNVTLCFSAAQGLLAAKAGATYISPFVGRLDDISSDGLQLIQELRVIYDNFNFKTQILVASVRHPLHVTSAAKIGADVATLPYKVIEQLLKHPLTDSGLAAFLKDWENMSK